MIFGNIVLITTGKPNELQKIHNHLEKAENVLFLHMVGGIPAQKFAGFGPPKKAVCGIPPLLKCGLRSAHPPPCRLRHKKYCSLKKFVKKAGFEPLKNVVCRLQHPPLVYPQWGPKNLQASAAPLRKQSAVFPPF